MNIVKIDQLLDELIEEIDKQAREEGEASVIAGLIAGIINNKLIKRYRLGSVDSKSFYRVFRGAVEHKMGLI